MLNLKENISAKDVVDAELKKEKKDISPIEDTKFCFGAKVNGENLLKD